MIAARPHAGHTSVQPAQQRATCAAAPGCWLPGFVHSGAPASDTRLSIASRDQVLLAAPIHWWPEWHLHGRATATGHPPVRRSRSQVLAAAIVAIHLRVTDTASASNAATITRHAILKKGEGQRSPGRRGLGRPQVPHVSPLRGVRRHLCGVGVSARSPGAPRSARAAPDASPQPGTRTPGSGSHQPNLYDGPKWLRWRTMMETLPRIIPVACLSPFPILPLSRRNPMKKRGGTPGARARPGAHGQREPRQRTFCQLRRSAAARDSSPGPHAASAQCVP